MSKEVIYRVRLAPDKMNGDWTVGDLKLFTEECSHQNIPDDTPLTREPSDYPFGAEGKFYAERVVEL